VAPVARSLYYRLEAASFITHGDPAKAGSLKTLILMKCLVRQTSIVRKPNILVSS